MTEEQLKKYERMGAGGLVQAYRELQLRAANLETVANASMGVSGQIKDEASKLGFNPASDDDPLSYLIELAKQSRMEQSEVTHKFTDEELKERDEQITRQVMTYAHARYTSGYIEAVKTNSDDEVQSCVDHLSKGEGDE